MILCDKCFRNVMESGTIYKFGSAVYCEECHKDIEQEFFLDYINEKAHERRQKIKEQIKNQLEEQKREKIAQKIREQMRKQLKKQIKGNQIHEMLRKEA